jgi:dTMP kinase
VTRRAPFISLEGGEGCGKTTQIALLSDALTKRNIAHIVTREPGGTVLAEQLRALVVQSQQEEWLPLSEMLLFLAARHEHVHKKILPALNAGTLVISDRFHDSSRVYQGLAKACGVGLYDMLHRALLSNITPDITFLLDVDPEIGLKRAATRHNNETRFEQLDIHFHHTLRQGFLQLAKAEPHRFIVCDASKSSEQVHQQIMQCDYFL